MSEPKKHVNASTFILMISTLCTRVLGFVKIAVINAVFGAAGSADVLNAVFSIPNNLRKLMAEGALSSAFIPQLNKHLAQNDEQGAARLSQKIMGFQYVVLIPLTILAIIYSDHVINIFTHFTSPSEQALAAHLFKYFTPYLLIVSISAILMAVLNSHNHFLIPSLSPLLFSVAVIGAIVFLSPQYGVYSMAIGVITGGLLQIVVQLPLYKKHGYQLKPSFAFRDPSFMAVLKHWLPVLLTSSVFAINQQVAVYLASGLKSGSSSALANAIVFFNLPYGIFSASINTAYFPRMSRLAHAKNFEELNNSLMGGLNLLLIFLLPSTLIMSVLGKEIISVAFMRGAFRPENAALAAHTLTGFCSGMFFVAAYNFIQRYFYSRGSFNMPFISAIVTCIIDIIISLILIKTPLGVAGLAYANAIAFTLSFFVLSLLARRLYGPLPFGKLFVPFLKILLACAASFFVYRLLASLFGTVWWQEPSSLKTLGLLFIFGLGMSLTVLAGYILLKVNFMEGLRRKRS